MGVLGDRGSGIPIEPIAQHNALSSLVPQGSRRPLRGPNEREHPDLPCDTPSTLA